MAVKRVIPLNQIEGVTAGGTATVKLPIGPRYHSVVLQYDTDTAGGATEANMEAEVTEVRVNIDNVTQRKASSAQIFDINRTKGRAPVVGDGTAPGYIPLFFSEPHRETALEKEVTAWGTKDIGSFQIEVDIANNSGQVPNLKGYAVVDDVMEVPNGIVKWKRELITISSTGETVHKLDTLRGDSYQGAYFFENANGDINDLLIEWDGVKIYDLTEYQVSSVLSSIGLLEVSGLVHVPFDFNHPGDAIPSVKRGAQGNLIKVQEFLTTLNMGAANDVTLIRELVGSPD